MSDDSALGQVSNLFLSSFVGWPNVVKLSFGWIWWFLQWATFKKKEWLERSTCSTKTSYQRTRWWWQLPLTSLTVKWVNCCTVHCSPFPCSNSSLLWAMTCDYILYFLFYSCHRCYRRSWKSLCRRSTYSLADSDQFNTQYPKAYMLSFLFIFCCYLTL